MPEPLPGAVLRHRRVGGGAGGGEEIAPDVRPAEAPRPLDPLPPPAAAAPPLPPGLGILGRLPPRLRRFVDPGAILRLSLLSFFFLQGANTQRMWMVGGIMLALYLVHIGVIPDAMAWVRRRCERVLRDRVVQPVLRGRAAAAAGGGGAGVGVDGTTPPPPPPLPDLPPSTALLLMNRGSRCADFIVILLAFFVTLTPNFLVEEDLIVPAQVLVAAEERVKAEEEARVRDAEAALLAAAAGAGGEEDGAGFMEGEGAPLPPPPPHTHQG